MATGDKQLSINIRAVTGELTSGLNKAKADIKGWASASQDSIAAVEASTERISRLWRSAFEAFIGVAAVDVLKKLALGAADAANELAVAARVAQNFGNKLDPTSMERWLEAFARSAKGGGYAIDDMRKSVQQFSDLGLDAAQTQRAIADTAELAASRNLDWASAAHIVQMALTGHVEMLSRYGIISREAAKHIHTVEDAMRALEKASSGAAEERADTLPGAFGRLATSASLLRDALGTGLIPMFQTAADVLSNLADAIAKIPAPVLKVATEIVGLATAVAATVLILPAIAKGFAIMGEGVKLVTGLVLPLITFVGRLTQTLGLASTGFEAFTGAELASMGPIALVVAAIAGIVIAIVELTRHMDHVKTAWRDMCQYLSDAFHEFVQNFQRDHSVVIKLLAQLAKANFDLMVAHNPIALKSDLANIASTAAPNTTRIEGPKLGADAGRIGTDIVSDWKKIGKQVLDAFTGLFKSSLGATPGIPHPKFPGSIPGGGKGGAENAADNALKNAEDAVKQLIAAIANRVADARHGAEKATTAVDLYKAGLPGGEPQNEAQAAQLQKLITNEMRAQLMLHNALQEQQHAELSAAAGFEQYAAKISTHLKNHDALVRQAKDAALEHVRAAQQLGEEYLHIGVTVAQLKNDMRAAFQTGLTNQTNAAADAAEQILAAQKIANDQNVEAINQAMAMAQVGGSSGISFSGPAPSESVRHAQQQVERESRTGGRQGDTTYQDRLKVALAELAVTIAQDTVVEKQKIVTGKEALYEQLKTQQAMNEFTQAQMEAAQAALDLTKANDNLAVAQQKLQLDLAQKWDQLMNGLIEKTGAPGLSGAGTATSPLNFNPLAVLFAAIEQTHSFADIMTTVTQIMQTFAEAMDALKPIIDALLDVIRAVVNVFIFMYNAVARILDLFGMQIQQLQYLNAAIGELVPLIEIWHEIPTLNELAAGKLNSPLSTQPQGLQSVGGPGQGQNALMKVVEILTGILVAIIVERVISGMSLAQAVQQTMHLIGINVGTIRGNAQAVALSAQEKAVAVQVGTKSDAIAQVIGAKAAGMTVTTNSLLTEMEATLVQILTAIQMQAAAGAAGPWGALLSVGRIAVQALSGGGPNAGPAVGGAGPLGQVQQAVASFKDALTAGIATLQAHTQALRDNLAGFQALTSAVRDMTVAARSFPGTAQLSAISTALSLDTSRRIAVSGSSIDRVPGMG